MNNFLKFIRKYPTVAVFIFYAALAVILTFPLTLKFGSEVPKGGGDVFQSIAGIENRVDQLQNEGLIGGIKNLAKTYQLNTFFPYVLVSYFSNTIFSYNFWFILSFVLSAFGAYLLAFYFTGNRRASFLAGIIFAFSPFHFYQSTSVHLGTMHQEWIPFFVLYLFKFFEKFELKYFFLFIAFASIIALTEHQLLAFTVIFSVIFIIFKFIADKEILKNKRFWAYMLTLFLFVVLIIVLLFAPLMKVATSSENYLNPGIGKADKYSMEYLDPLIPPVSHTLWPDISRAIQKIVPSGAERGSYFIGLGVFAVIVYGFWLRKNNHSDEKRLRTGIYFWLIESVVFYIFALGPSISIFDRKIYLPYFLVYKFVPFYENIRTTGRFFVYAMLGVALLFAFAFPMILKRHGNKKILTAAFCIVILIEFMFFPLKTMSLSHSPFYDRIASEKENYFLLEIPGSTNYEFASYASYTASIHKKDMINGMPIARKIEDQFDFQRETPVIKQLLYTLPKGNDPDKKNPPEYYRKANEILNQNNIKYVTISKKYLKKKYIDRTVIFIEKYIKYDEKYEDDHLIAYKIHVVLPIK